MKQKPMYQIVQMAKDELSPKANVRVTSQRKQSIHPAVNLMLSEKDKYATADVETYQSVYEVVSAWDTFDMVQFTLQWPSGETITITRGFFFDVPEMPIVESVVSAKVGEESQGQIYVRQDILATYQAYQKASAKLSPNVRITNTFLYTLFMNQDLDWDDVLASYAGKLKLDSIVLNKSFKGVEHFVRNPSTRTQIKFITGKYMPGHKVASMKDSAALAIHCALNSLVDTIARQVYGTFNDETIAHVLNADVHLSSLGLVTEKNENGFEEEIVYAVVKDDKLYLAFGSLDMEDGINDLLVEFDLDDEDVTKDTVKTVKFIYPNLV